MKRYLALVLLLVWILPSFAQSPCNGQTEISYEGYDYDIVEIDGRCWFAENLRYLPSVSPSTQTGFGTPYFYVAGYEGITVEDAIQTENYLDFGVLYNWTASQESFH